MANAENTSVPKRRVGNVIKRPRPSINSIWLLKMLCKFRDLEIKGSRLSLYTSVGPCYIQHENVAVLVTIVICFINFKIQL